MVNRLLITGDINIDILLGIILAPLIMFISYKFVNLKYKHPKRLKEKIFVNSFRMKIGNPLLTIIIPFLLGFGLKSLWNNPEGINANPILIAMSSVAIQPMVEEWIFRGLVLGSFIILAQYKSKNSRIIFYSYVFIGLILQALIFTLSHMYEIRFFISLFSESILLGLLYFLSKRNLLPPTVAHMAGNLFIFLVTL